MNPSIVDDGDFSVPVQNGSDEYSYPFLEQGDNKSFEMRRPFVVQSDKYKAPELMARLTTLKGLAYLVEDDDPRDVGQGLVAFNRIYASVPVTRHEGTQIVYGMQFYSVADEELAEIQIPLNARVRYEYSLNPMNPIIAPRAFMIFGELRALGGWGTLVPGNEYPAEDSTTGIYKGGIWFRRTVLIKYPDAIAV